MLNPIGINPVQNTLKPHVVNFPERMETSNLNNQTEKVKKRMGLEKCDTCESRRYQDVSNDPGVSFKSPTHISPESSAAAVSMHEREHVVRNQADAIRSGRELVYQQVQLASDICPECGKAYISGGKTTTVTQGKQPPPKNEPGQIIDLYA